MDNKRLELQRNRMKRCRAKKARLDLKKGNNVESGGATSEDSHNSDDSNITDVNTGDDVDDGNNDDVIDHKYDAVDDDDDFSDAPELAGDDEQEENDGPGRDDISDVDGDGDSDSDSDSNSDDSDDSDNDSDDSDGYGDASDDSDGEGNDNDDSDSESGGDGDGDDYDDIEDDNGDFRRKIGLIEWSIKCRILHVALDNLLSVLRRDWADGESLPKSSKTLLGTLGARYVIRRMADLNGIGGEFTYCGIQEGLEHCINPDAHETDDLDLQFYCDGLSVSR